MSDVQISKNFKLSEFACKCGCDTHLREDIKSQVFKLVKEIYQPLRDEAGCPLHINSGVRCDKWNTLVGGALNSWHKKGGAGDTESEDHTPKELMAIALKLEREGKIKLGGRKAYGTFCHFDTGPKRTW